MAYKTEAEKNAETIAGCGCLIFGTCLVIIAILSVILMAHLVFNVLTG